MKKKYIQRDFNKLLHLRGEINLATRSVSIGKKRYVRKSKHKILAD